MGFVGDGDKAANGDADVDVGEDLRDYECPSRDCGYGFIPVRELAHLISPIYILTNRNETQETRTSHSSSSFPKERNKTKAKSKETKPQTNILETEKKREIHNLHSLGPLQTQKNQQQHPQPFTHENPRPQPLTITIHSPQHTASPNDSEKRKQATAKPSKTMRAAVVVCGDEGKGEEDDLGDGNAVAVVDVAITGAHFWRDEILD